ncbi:MAG: hypothetical protein KZQ58_02905 [gamma proteobacterium symbiont of Bathyaustriella thionipta]|nr:hypothetical protein [gamma proteobacterium symbiont of Bathyaustriella thionipta]
MKFFQLCLSILLFCLSASLFALPLQKLDIPEPLLPWTGWVLQNHKDQACPMFYNSNRRQCAWPAHLSLDLEQQGGHFSQQWQVYADSWIQLPGSEDRWPLAVKVNDAPAAVVSRGTRPFVRLQKGSYRISGQFLWRKLPEALAVPAASGLIRLRMNQKDVPRPVFNHDKLWLQHKADSSQQAEPNDSVRLQVFRRVLDQHPMQVDTLMILHVSGSQRELLLPDPLLENFIPLKLSSRLPARIEANGDLRLQVRPGQWQIHLVGRHHAEISQLELGEHSSPWPNEEVWSFEAAPQLRLVKVEGVPAVDPRQTAVPDNWKKLPAYRVRAHDVMKLQLLRRGDAQGSPDKLKLQRSLWLDFDGGGYTIKDNISGRMNRNWRLSMNPPIQLGSVRVNGEPRLITRLPDDKTAGTELRLTQINLQADSRYEGDISRFPANGWKTGFQQAQASLQLPPGWRLLAVSGVDTVSNSWLRSWSLMDLFLLLISAIAVARLWGWLWGVLALCTLALTWHEALAPTLVWLNILLAVALWRVLPGGRMKQMANWYRRLALLSLLLISLLYAVQAVRSGLYPQLEHPWQAADSVVDVSHGMSFEEEADRTTSVARQLPTSLMAEKLALKRSGSGKSWNQASLPAAPLTRIEPDARVQTGPGLPDWQWQAVQLGWNGPLEPDQQVHLYLISPAVHRLLNFFSIFLIALLGFRLAWEQPWPALPAWLRKNKSAQSLIWLAGLGLLLPMAPEARADMPTAPLLKELQSRLLQPADCLPDCAAIERLYLRLDDEGLSGRLAAHVLEDSALPLPMDVRQWQPQSVWLDDEAVTALMRDSKGQLWIPVTAGLHQIRFAGAAPQGEHLQLRFPLNPHRIEMEAAGWQVEGLSDHRAKAGVIQLSRIQKAQQAADKRVLTPSTLPAFVRIQRTLVLDQKWTINTRVMRQSPVGTPILLRIPLWLSGESVISDNIQVENGYVLLRMGPQQKQANWHSTLPEQRELLFKASDNPAWSEQWQLQISPLWHVRLTGIAPLHQRGQGWSPEWQPWPAEEVHLQITRPQAVAGATVTIDKSLLQIQPGIRMTDASLSITMRSTLGGQHRIRLPAQASLQAVSMNGRSLPLRLQNGQITLPLTPGVQQVQIDWQQSDAMQLRYISPQIDLGAPSVNSRIEISPGQNRWILFAFGPPLGPAVLIWGVLTVIFLLALVLGRIQWTPLRFHHWFLLGIGLTQVSPAVGVAVVAWLFALGTRCRMDMQRSKKWFNLIQLVLLLMTLLAISGLFSAVQSGLLGSPEMQIAGNGSNAWQLNWYQDRVAGVLPQAEIISVPLLVYRGMMLAWALWLAFALLGWLRWGWGCYSKDGVWRTVSIQLPNRAARPAKDKVE